MENLRSGELYVFSDNEFFNPPSYAVVSGWACDGISLSMVGRLPLKRMSRRSVGKSADDKRDRPCRFVSLPLQAVRRGEGLAQMPRFDSGAIDRAALGNGIVFFI